MSIIITATKNIGNKTYEVKADVEVVGKGNVVGSMKVIELAPKKKNRLIFTPPFSFELERVEVMSPIGKIQGKGYIVKDFRILLASDGFASQEMAMHHLLQETGLSDELLDDLLEGVHRRCLALSKKWSLDHLKEFTRGDLKSMINLATAIRGSWSESVFKNDPEDGHMKTAWRLCRKAVAHYKEVEGSYWHSRIPPEKYLGEKATRAILEFHFHMEDNRVSEDGRSYTRAFHRTMSALAQV